MGFSGGKVINVPWGVSIDGKDQVWVANILGRGVLLMAGAEPKGQSSRARRPAMPSMFPGGSIQMLTDVVIDPAGNIWAANNWNSLEAAIADEPAHAISTWGGGSGLTVIYGVAAPVKTPLMGPVRAN